MNSIFPALSLMVDNVTIRGRGMDKSILNFSDQDQGGEGLFVGANGVTLEGFAIINPKGDGIKVLEADQVRINQVRVVWTRGPHTQNGGYGLYPVKCKGVIIEGSYVSGASDSGIYVGQSSQITVRRNHVENNVAGIEIENSTHARVYANYAVANTAGILVFNLPDLSRIGSDTTIHSNIVVGNNLPNFSRPANTVAVVPQGTGIMVLANKNVRIHNNLIKDHKTASIALLLAA